MSRSINTDGRFDDIAKAFDASGQMAIGTWYLCMATVCKKPDGSYHISEVKMTRTPIESGNSCCENESRNINGGCDNCGAPCL